MTKKSIKIASPKTQPTNEDDSPTQIITPKKTPKK
jgi:hypothetical protein